MYRDIDVDEAAFHVSMLPVCSGNSHCTALAELGRQPDRTRDTGWTGDWLPADLTNLEWQVDKHCKPMVLISSVEKWRFTCSSLPMPYPHRAYSYIQYSL